MASKASGKIKTVLYGGPLSGETVKLSGNHKSKKYSWSVSTATFIFKIRNEVGQYIDGRWQEYEDPCKVNSNILLGYN
jgi:hypothetical protein